LVLSQETFVSYTCLELSARINLVGLLLQVERNYKIDVPIFKQYHKNVIGKGGANIRKIREQTNTQVRRQARNIAGKDVFVAGKDVFVASTFFFLLFFRNKTIRISLLFRSCRPDV